MATVGKPAHRAAPATLLFRALIRYRGSPTLFLRSGEEGGVLSRYTFGPFYVCRNWAVKKRGSYNAKVLIRGAATHRRRNSADRKCK
jgi:hypothetical protein